MRIKKIEVRISEDLLYNRFLKTDKLICAELATLHDMCCVYLAHS